MTRTNTVALGRPHAVGAAPLRQGSSRAARRLLVLPLVLLAMAFVLPTGALAASTGEAGYGTTAPAPKTTTTSKPTTTEKTPASGTSPSKESSTPSSGVAPAKTSSTNSSMKTLPFTGFDLRWTVGIGLLLVAMGFSIVAAQRRQRRSSGS
jgi:hypothetical protein